MTRTPFTDEEIRAVGHVPEPSPLFWEHLSERVRASVETQAVPASWWAAMWTAAWRPAVTAMTVIAIVGLALVGQPRDRAPLTEMDTASLPSGVADVASIDAADGLWRMIDALAPLVPADEAKNAGLIVTASATNAAIEQLTDAERRELVRLLRAEIGSSE